MAVQSFYDDDGYLILKDGGRLEEEADCFEPRGERDKTTEAVQQDERKAEEEEEEEENEEDSTPALGATIQSDGSISKKQLGFLVLMCLLCFLLVCAMCALVLLLEKERTEVLQLKEERNELMHEVLKCNEGFSRQRDDSNNRWNSIVDYLNWEHLIVNLEQTGIKLITRFSKPFPPWRRWRDFYTGDEE